MREIVTLHEDKIIQVKSPLPFPLKWVNSYLIKGHEGYTLLDPGLHTKQSEEHWEQVLNDLHISYGDISEIVLTHHHPDHFGMTGYFQERTSVPVYLSAAGKLQTERMWGVTQPLVGEIVQLFRKQGMEEGLLDEMSVHFEDTIAQVNPQPKLTTMEAGTIVRLGGEEYETIHAPGHAEGHLCFYQRDSKRMICGDQVLPQISPNVSLIPGMDENPLGSFLRSLQELGAYEVERAFPGHREPFAKFSERAAELIVHHEQRLAVIREHLKTPMTGYQLCRALFGERLTIHQLRFAMAEALAHLIYLREVGVLEEIEGIRDGVSIWKAAL